MPAGLRLLFRGCRTVAQIQGAALLCFFPNPANFSKTDICPKLLQHFCMPSEEFPSFFCVTHLTFKSTLTLWYFTCFAKDETTWDCAASIWIPVCRLLLVKSVRGNYSQSYSYILQSVCSEDFIGLSGRSTKQLDSGNYTT